MQNLKELGKPDLYTLVPRLRPQNTLNGKMVRLTLHSGKGNGKEFYYDFEYRGTPIGTHYTL